MNSKFLRKISKNKIKMLHMPYRAVIEQGVGEGAFDTSFPEETAELVIHMSISLNSVAKRLAAGIKEKPENIGVIKRKIEAYGDAVERLLGAKKSSINLLEVMGVFERFL